MTFPNIMEDFLRDPTPEHRDRLRPAIMDAPRYDPLVSIASLLAEGSGTDTSTDEATAARAVIDTIWEHMPALFLSPQAHLHLARAYSTVGAHKYSERERKLAALSLDSIRGDGTGGEDSPFQVLRVEDEYDLLASSRLRSVGQTLRESDESAFDIHTLEDGASLWFELLWRRRS